MAKVHEKLGKRGSRTRLLPGCSKIPGYGYRVGNECCTRGTRDLNISSGGGLSLPGYCPQYPGTRVPGYPLLFCAAY
eukprot:1950836-Rhodomonas_salina.1